MTRTTPWIAVILFAGLAGFYANHGALAADTARSLPVFEVDPAWPKMPPQWKLGDPSSIAFDAQDNVWVLHRPRTLKGPDLAMAAPPVIVFSGNGDFVKAWGGDGDDWPQREHGIHIDYKGYVWLGGNNCPASGHALLKPVADDALLKFTQDGKFILQIGKSNQSKGDRDTANVHRAADVRVDPKTDELYVADGYGNHRVIVFDANCGTFKRRWGAFGKPAGGIDHCDIVRPKSFGEGLPDYFKQFPVYYAGPAKTPAGMASGSFGPTTAGRMDSYVDLLQANGGSMVMLAKGNRSKQVVDACRKHKGFYLGSIGGPAAILAQDVIKKVEVLEYPELGMEAIWRIQVENFPAFIITDDKGNDFFSDLKI